ncbi:ArsC/Spx/MgsR family protein [Kribbella sp. NPDC051620]|uniref:ArsC/Spx/MgsR family protein n=1 Tax=Kribbella sp. NPDC051620 TaxID=3364120 RepID=UPI00379A78F6
MEIWINPSCSKCQAATTALDEAGIPCTVRRYLDDPPTAEELEAVLTRLNLAPWHITRMNEPAAAAVADLPMDDSHRPDWIAALIANPILIQRPILTTDDGTTAIPRDPETLTRLIGD